MWLCVEQRERERKKIQSEVRNIDVIIRKKNQTLMQIDGKRLPRLSLTNKMYNQILVQRLIMK